jgi:hypothetical protein
MAMMDALGDGHVWIDALVLIADLEVDAEAVRELLPPGLELASPPTATVFVADYPETAFGSSYREAALLLHGRDEHGPLRHCSWMVVDDDTALILGREVLGFPKKMADITLEVSDGHVVGSVSLKGVEVMRIECDLSDDPPGTAPVFAHRFVNACGTMVHGLDLIEIPTASGSVRVLDATERRRLLQLERQLQQHPLSTEIRREHHADRQVRGVVEAQRQAQRRRARGVGERREAGPLRELGHQDI